MEEVSRSRKKEEEIITSLKKRAEDIFELYKGTIIDSTVEKFMEYLDQEIFPPYEVTYDFDFNKDFYNPLLFSIPYSQRHLKKLILKELRQKLTSAEISVTVDSAPEEEGYYIGNSWVTTYRYLKTTISIKYNFH